MGEKTYVTLLEKRMELFENMKSNLERIAEKYGEVIIPSPRNTISMSVSLRSLDACDPSFVGKDEDGHGEHESTKNSPSRVQKGPSYLGSMLFQRAVSGCRVVSKSSKVTKIEDTEFSGWGSHATAYPFSYFTAACAIGQTEEDVKLFLERLDKVMKKMNFR